MVLSLLADIPLSDGHDFLGPITRRRVRDEEPVKEEPVKEEPVKEEPIQEEIVEEVIVPEPIMQEPPQETTVLPEPIDIPEETESSAYTEVSYAELAKGNGIDGLPPFSSGNYVIIYRNENCPYCDKLIDELKGNIDNYYLVVVQCSRSVPDLFYRRQVYYFPSFIVITNNKVRYYGVGYRTLEEFKRYL